MECTPPDNAHTNKTRSHTDLNRPLTTYIHSSFNGQSVLNLIDVVKAEMLPLI